MHRVHEWWGITKHIHSEARQFAQQGYTAFIADMYGDAKTADNPKYAGALSGSVMKNPTVMESRFNAARDQLAKQASVNPQRIGAVGYCFGGAVVLNMARAGANLAAVAVYMRSGSRCDRSVSREQLKPWLTREAVMLTVSLPSIADRSAAHLIPTPPKFRMTLGEETWNLKP